MKPEILALTRDKRIKSLARGRTWRGRNLLLAESAQAALARGTHALSFALHGTDVDADFRFFLRDMIKRGQMWQG